MTLLYKLDGIQCQRGNRVVLNIDSLRIEAGKIYSLTGPNGAGKTTLLNLLAFLDSPDHGVLSFNSSPVDDGELRRLSRQRVVLVDQYPILFSGPVWKNIEFGLKIRKVPKKKRLETIEKVLEMVGMENFYHASGHTLSGGETKRVALARALAIEPEVMLCDEPTANVDVENQEIIVKILERCNGEDKISLVVATHSLSQAGRLAHETIILNNGKLAQGGSENNFMAVLATGSDGLCSCLVDGVGTAMASIVENAPKGRFRVCFDPKRILCRKSQMDDSSKDNTWAGEIISISKENGFIRMGVDCGQTLTVLVQCEKYNSAPLYVSEKVNVTVPEDAIRIIG